MLFILPLKMPKLWIIGDFLSIRVLKKSETLENIKLFLDSDKIWNLNFALVFLASTTSHPSSIKTYLRVSTSQHLSISEERRLKVTVLDLDWHNCFVVSKFWSFYLDSEPSKTIGILKLATEQKWAVHPHNSLINHLCLDTLKILCQVRGQEWFISHLKTLIGDIHFFSIRPCELSRRVLTTSQTLLNKGNFDKFSKIVRKSLSQRYLAK